MLKIIKNPDIETYIQVSNAIKANNGYCPCSLIKNQDTKCMCKNFRELEEGECHCGLFVKIKDE